MQKENWSLLLTLKTRTWLYSEVHALLDSRTLEPAAPWVLRVLASNIEFDHWLPWSEALGLVLHHATKIPRSSACRLPVWDFTATRIMSVSPLINLFSCVYKRILLVLPLWRMLAPIHQKSCQFWLHIMFRTQPFLTPPLLPPESGATFSHADGCRSPLISLLPTLLIYNIFCIGNQSDWLKNF
jgi:hypothetical protein